MTLTRFEPLFDLLDRDFNRTLRGTSQKRDARWVPAVDIVEEEERFVLRADVPGVSPEDIDISMDKGVLTVAGERRADSGTETNGIRRIERRSGRFERRFTLPETADAGRISANSKNGTLEVSIPKLAEVKPRRITVEAA